jgi:chemotaxis protein methyltransferase CheR
MISTTAFLGTANTQRVESCITPENYEFLQREVHQNSGIVLDETKRYLIEMRLAPVLDRERISTINDLCALLRATASPALRQTVIEAMTTNETLFFRDDTPFQALKTTVLPELIEKRRSVRKLSFWSAASSSGQEAYSIAMLLLELGLADWDIRILGTDLSRHMLKRAREGRYTQVEVNRGLPPEYLAKYFRRVGTEYQIDERARRMTEFTHFDLRQSTAGLGLFDIVFCRNVLIYFDLETKRKILAELGKTLQAKGLLLLGCAESTHNLNSSFQKKLIDKAIFYEMP